MSSEEARASLQKGDLERARSLLFEHVRSHPEDTKARIFLFQFLAVEGDWERAAKQLAICAESDAEAIPLAAVYSAAIDAEKVRAEVFAGREAPVFFGRPPEWTANLVQALKADAEGHAGAAAELRQEAMETADAVPGTADDQPFAWICDADARLGPVLEVVLSGSYHWLPFQHIEWIRFAAPSDLRDVVWTEAELALTNGGQMAVLVPTRYPGAEASGDTAIRLARRTGWTEIGEGMFAGEGQRMLATDQADLSLMEVRNITMTHAA